MSTAAQADASMPPCGVLGQLDAAAAALLLKGSQGVSPGALLAKAQRPPALEQRGRPGVQLADAVALVPHAAAQEVGGAVVCLAAGRAARLLAGGRLGWCLAACLLQQVVFLNGGRQEGGPNLGLPDALLLLQERPPGQRQVRMALA